MNNTHYLQGVRAYQSYPDLKAEEAIKLCSHTPNEDRVLGFEEEKDAMEEL